MKNWTLKYADIPYKNKGRDFTGVDCWGLVKLIYHNELKIDLPSYGEISATNLIAVSKNITVGKDGEEWKEIEIEKLQEFDIAVMKFPGTKRIGHVGIMIDFFNVLHIEENKNVVSVPLNHFSIRERIACFRRHKTIK